jgi:hypothetical protein
MRDPNFPFSLTIGLKIDCHLLYTSNGVVQVFSTAVFYAARCNTDAVGSSDLCELARLYMTLQTSRSADGLLQTSR